MANFIQSVAFSFRVVGLSYNMRTFVTVSLLNFSLSCCHRISLNINLCTKMATSCKLCNLDHAMKVLYICIKCSRYIWKEWTTKRQASDLSKHTKYICVYTLYMWLSLHMLAYFILLHKKNYMTFILLAILNYFTLQCSLILWPLMHKVL